MFEIQTNDHHYIAKSVFLGALILILGITTWANVFAQRAVKMSLPQDDTITVAELNITNENSESGDSSGDSHPLEIILSGDFEGVSGAGINHPSESEVKIESSYSGSLNPSTGVVVSGVNGNLGRVDDDITDTAIIYARKIEALITIKGQETRMDMLITMNKFLSNYPPEHQTYRTISRMVDIITLGDVAHKLEYCTQYEGDYVLELFGMPLNIYSTIRYDSQLQKCQITYQYPDKSVHTCRLNEQQKVLLSRAMKQKQGLNKFNPDWVFESVVEGFLSQRVCFESQKAIVVFEGTGSSLSGSTASGSVLTGKTVTSWRKNRGK